jgi:tetratricopeptide (TPR) repeat protein
MSTVARSCWLPIVLVMVTPALAQHHHSGAFASYSSHGHGHGHSPVVASGGYIPGGGGYFPGGGGNPYRGYGLGAVGGGYGYFGSGFGLSYGIGYYQPPLVLAFPIQPLPVAQGGGGLMLPLPPQGFANPNPPQARRLNPARAKELVEIGDRSFRAGNIKRAEEKYNLAVKADPTSPVPHVHLAQVSMARGDYAAAADHLRDAITVATDPGWLINAPDIQTIFGEPADFAKQLARLESHLQANPTDRDAWFVLGAECYLSGRSRQASDVFQRLTDRRPDEALSAFLGALTTRNPQPAAN